MEFLFDLRMYPEKGLLLGPKFLLFKLELNVADCLAFFAALLSIL